MSNSPTPMDEDPGSPGPPPLLDQNGMDVKAPVQKSARPAQPEVTHRIIKQKEKKRVDVTELNPHIVCAICSGYLIDPVTVVECLHSFCKSCIIKHVDTSKFCPTCDIQIHKTKPLLSLRADKALQDIVYKVVPGLYRTEMQNRIKFYTTHPEAEPANSEDAGEVADSLFFSPEDDISMSIEYFDNFKKTDDINKNCEEIDMEKENPNRRFLQCPGSVTVHHLKKFIMTKYSLDQSFLVDVIYKEDLLPEDHTLIDVAYSYNWRKTSPMRFYYRIYQKTKVLTRKRKKKKTKTNSKSQPAKKRRNIDSTPSFNNVETRQENGMEIDDEESKKANISPKLKSDGGDTAKAKINSVKDKDAKKVNPIKVNPIKVNPLKVNPSKVIPPAETKSVKSVTINHNTSFSANKAEKPQQKAKPISPPIKAVKPVISDKKPKSPPVLVRSVPAVSETQSQSSATTTVSHNPIKPTPQPSKKSLTVGTSAPSTNKTSLMQTKPVSNGKAVTSVSSDTPKKNTPVTPTPIKESVKEKVSQPIQNYSLATTTVTATTTTATTKDKVVTNGHKVDTSSKIPEKEAATKVTSSEKYLNKIVPDLKKPTSEKEVVEISVEVSASDVKKVLEKKKAEKDARMMSNGEERLYSNYSIVDQLKKGAAAANLARQKKQASMMDFTRTSEALNAPKVPPIIQGLQPKVTSSSETNVLSAIVHSLAQKQQSLNQKIQAVTSNSESKSVDKSKDSSTSVADSISKEKGSVSSEAVKPKPSEATKTLGTIVAPTLSTKTSQEKPSAQKPVTTITPKLPGSTSIKPITKESHQIPTSVETTGSKGQQMLNFYKNNFPKTSTSQEATKSAETLTKNIPAGTTVTVKTVENKQARTSPSTTPTSKTSAFRMNLSNSNYSLAKQVTNPYSSVTAASQPALMNPFVHSQMSMALAAQQAAQQHAQYLNFSNQQIAAAAALSAHVEAVANANYINNTAANLVRAAAAAQITQSPMTTLAFTKPISSYDEHRFGLKIPQPNVSRHHSPSVSSFGTSRLQVKVNSDSPKAESPKSLPTTKSDSNFSSNTNTSSSLGDTSSSNTTATTSYSKISSGTHSMPAMLPFYGVKKVQALPKTVNQGGRSLPISSLINKNQNNTSTKSPPLTNSPPRSPVVSSKPNITSASSIQSLTDSNPFKTSAPVKQITTNFDNNLGKISSAQTPTNIQNPYKPVTQVNSLKKLVADLNSVQQKSKAENILNTLKKNSENKLLSESKKSFLGIDRNKNEKPKEVTSS
eukprot:TRINITY_DN6715_c0_g1_i1.p1 TRINITY_DN6715_c0_g1~~TRINITY_DN6715_c0_g1_i1.p1  ORF type:complete len:1264 (-),score=266.76 TRINITY_DN6715_c0_g1_i1:252-4043(-)